MRAIKSAPEIEVLRRVGLASAQALRAGMSSVRPGRPQREAEAAVVSACIDAGAEGPSFWPWTMAGPTSAFPAPFESLFDYRHLRTGRMEPAEAFQSMLDGELRGRLSRRRRAHRSGLGRFDAGQRETWELLVAAYRAGMRKFRDGVKRDDVFAASLAEVRRLQPALSTPLGMKAAESFWRPAA